VSAVADAAWMVEAGLASALLMALVLVVRAPVRRAFGAGVAYALWALPALRLVLPPLPAGWTAGWSATPVSRAGEVVVAVIVQPAPDALTMATTGTTAGAAIGAAVSSGPSAAAFLAAAWALGAAAFLAWAVIGYWRMRARLLAQHRPLERVGRVRVVESAEAAGPLAFGVLKRYVVMPADLAERYDADERELALAHELGHHARGDLLANWAALVVLAVHWFNPLAWRAFRAFRADQELACDARVLAGRRRADRLVYACAIVKAAHGGTLTPACHLHTVEDLKGRLRMLKLDPASRRRLAAGVASVGVLAAAGLALTASGTGAAAAVRAVEHVLPPAPPMPDAPEVSDVPAVPAAPATVPAAPRPPVAGGTGHRRVTVVTTRDGRTVTRSYDGDAPLPPEAVRALATAPVVPLPPAAPATPATPTTPDVPAVPSVRTVDCGGADGPTSLDRMENGRRVVLICRDRMRAAAKEAARASADAARAGRAAAEAGRAAAARGEALAAYWARRAPAIERDALRTAMSSLRDARRSVELAEMPVDSRRDALAGIDRSLREVEGKLRRLD